MDAAALADGPGDGRAGGAAGGLELVDEPFVGAEVREAAGFKILAGSMGLDGFATAPFAGRAAAGGGL